MFEHVLNLWKTYMTLLAEEWPDDDPRHHLAAEVRDRLAQLDIVLEYLTNAKDRVLPPAEEVERQGAAIRKVSAAFEAGEITESEFLSRVVSLGPTPEQARQGLRAHQELFLFTEVFYFVAWRVVQILRRRRGPLSFPGMERFEPRGVTLGRNHLVQHPERSGNLARHLLVTDEGPTLKSLVAVVRIGTGRVEPAEDSMGRVWPDAREMNEELRGRLEKALQGRRPRAGQNPVRGGEGG